MTYEAGSYSIDLLEVSLLELKEEMQRLRHILNHNFEIIHQIKNARAIINSRNVSELTNSEELL